jgi:hypothetical protein
VTKEHSNLHAQENLSDLPGKEAQGADTDIHTQDPDGDEDLLIALLINKAGGDDTEPSEELTLESMIEDLKKN